MHTTTHYLLHPRSPLVFGTGKPLDFCLGGDSLAFPFPTTVAGALRAAHSAANGQTPDPYSAIDGLQLQQLALARFDWLQPDKPATLLLPRPADAVYINQKMLHLAPQSSPAHSADSWVDLAPGLQLLALQGENEDKKGKLDPAPAWWSALDYSRWLADPKSQTQPITNAPDTQSDQRTHVVIEPHGKGAVTGGLFRSTGRDFGPSPQNKRSEATHGYALAISTQEPQSLDGNTRRLGGEGRFVRFENQSTALQEPAQPKGLDKATRIRFVLTTPAVFPDQGWHPDALAYDPSTDTIHGSLAINGKTIAVQLLAAAITRAQSYSGWLPVTDNDPNTGTNTVLQGRPGPGRPWRVVPAGSVYWLQVPKGDAPVLWGQSLCTDGPHGQWHTNGWGRGFVGLA